jgi:DNA-binding FrmR family transcriptional regulator
MKSKRKSTTKTCETSACQEENHPDHARVLARVNRVAGQLRGVAAMIEDRRYCVDILTQIKAVGSAMKAIEAEVLERHLRSCIQDAFAAKNPKEMEAKIRELVELF